MAGMRRPEAHRADLPWWEARIQWWAEHGAGNCTPHIPHQWGENAMLCARCGRSAVTRVTTSVDKLPGGGRVVGTLPPACEKHIASVDAEYRKHRIAWGVGVRDARRAAGASEAEAAP